jgi:DNA-binding CsgD family transcriptional regulator
MPNGGAVQGTTPITLHAQEIALALLTQGLQRDLLRCLHGIEQHSSKGLTRLQATRAAFEEMVVRLTKAYGEVSALSPSGAASDTVALTVRQCEVLYELSQGKTPKAIARAWNIKLSTVQSHIKEMYRRLEVGGRQEALQRAQAMGIIPRL